MRWALLVATCFVVLSGCSGAADVPDGGGPGGTSSGATTPLAGSPGDQGTPGGSSPANQGPSPSPTGGPGGSPVPKPVPVDDGDGAEGGDTPTSRFPLRGLTTFDIGGTEPAPWVVLEVEAFFGVQTECKTLIASTTAPTTPGLNMLTITVTEGSVGWGSSSQGGGLGYANAHVGPVDTNTLTTNSGQGSSRHSSTRTLEGVVRFTMVARDPVVADSQLLASGYAWGFTLSCEGPFDITMARQGATAAVVTAQSLSGGLGADIPLAGSANVEDVVKASFAANQTRAGAGAFGAHAARVDVTHPSSRDSWLFLPEEGGGLASVYYGLDDGPGDYSITVDRAGVYFEAFWCGAWGLDQELDLAMHWLTGSAVVAS